VCINKTCSFIFVSHNYAILQQCTHQPQFTYQTIIIKYLLFELQFSLCFLFVQNCHSVMFMHDACICVSWLFCCFQPQQSFIGPALVLFYYLNLVEALSNHLMTTHSAEQPQLKSNDESSRAILDFYKEEVMKQLDQMHRLENLMGIRRPTSDAMAREQLNSIIQRILMHQDWVKIHDWVSIQTRITACIVEEMQAEILRQRCQEWLRLPAFRSESSRRRAGLEYAMDNDPKLRGKYTQCQWVR